MPKASAVPASESPTVVINQTVPAREQPEEKKERTRIDFWPYIAGLSPDDWKRHEIYLYRTKPVVGHKEREKYLDIYNSKFTIEDVKARFGGEEFRAMLLRNGKNVCTVEFAIEAAPKFDLVREIPGVDTAQNATIQKLVDKLTDREDDPDVTGEAVQRSVNIMGNAFEAAASRLATTSPNGGGNLIETIKALKELGLIGMPQKNSVLETIQVLKELGIVGGPVAQFNPVAQIDTVLGIVEKLRDFGGGGGKTDWKTLAIEKLAEYTPEILRGVVSIGDKQVQLERERRSRVEAVERAASAVQGAQQQQPQLSPNGNPQPPASYPLATVAAPAQEQNPGNLPVVTFEQLGFNRIVEMVYRGEDGGAVMDFLYGLDPRAYDYLLECDAAGIRAILGGDPVLAKVLEYPHLDDFVAQVLEYSAEIKAAHADETTAKEPVKVN